MQYPIGTGEASEYRPPWGDLPQAYSLDHNLTICPDCGQILAAMGRSHKCRNVAARAVVEEDLTVGSMAYVWANNASTEEVENAWKTFVKLKLKSNDQVPTRRKGQSETEQIEAWLRAGELSKALEILEDTKLAEGPGVLQELKNLHPRGPTLHRRDTHDMQDAICIPASLVKRAVNKSSCAACPGISGLSYSVFKRMVETAEGLNEWTSVVNTIVGGDLPVDLSIRDSRLVAIQKPEGAGVRPIALSETIYRLASKCIAMA